MHKIIDEWVSAEINKKNFFYKINKSIYIYLIVNLFNDCNK